MLSQKQIGTICFAFIFSIFSISAFATSCPTGYATLDVEKHIDSQKTFAESTFMAVENGLCRESAYDLIEIPDDLVPIYNGFLMGSAVTLCDNGYRVNNGSCTSYTAGDCPTGYKDLALNENTMTTLSNGVCASGYRTYTLNQQCDANTDDAICGILCSDGLNYTDVGTCAELCSMEHKTLRTSTGLIYPMYAVKQITPSINIEYGGTTCYVNLVPGAVTDALHIRYDNQTYHAVK